MFFAVPCFVFQFNRLSHVFPLVRPIEAFLELDGKKWFMIYGHQVDPKRCKLFDKESMTISYYGLPLSPSPSQSRASSTNFSPPVVPSPVMDEKKTARIDGPLFGADYVPPKEYKPANPPYFGGSL